MRHQLFFMPVLSNVMYIQVQYVVEEVLGAHGMINYVDARTAWMDDIVKQAQWQGITQVRFDGLSIKTTCFLLAVCWH